MADKLANTPHFTLHTPHSTLYTPHSVLHTPHSTLSTPHCRLVTRETFTRLFKYKLLQKGIVRDCIAMCFDICTINIRVSIQENQRLETRHVDAEKPAFRTRLPPILTFLTHHQTGWNVTKCHACHAKRHDNFLGNLRKGEVLRLPT